ncbi:hypothetical protein DENSPDRAFT_831129 [Dentipellis sp. KUC8613]|nr:hypothetical protein DENSPDRAFT_831129 [Dentipellis sp. KUC8613]
MSSSMQTSWQQAWDEAQPRLQAFQHYIPSVPRAKIIRVGQLDAELLDEELVHILQEPFGKALNYIHSTLRARLEPELSLLIRLTLYKFSIWNTGASYGAKLQDLRYTTSKSSSRSSPSGLPRQKLLVHLLLTVIIPYFHSRIRDHALSHSWPEAPTSDKRRIAWETLTKMETIHSVVSLLNFVAFLWDGRYRTTADRILGLRLVPVQQHVKREVSYEFMNRQMVWHAFTEFLIFILPIFPQRTLRRTAGKITTGLSHPLTTLQHLLPARARSMMGYDSIADRSAASAARQGKYWHLADTECAICHENAASNLELVNPTADLAQQTIDLDPSAASNDESPAVHPLNNPYRTTCGHVYCYVCIADRMLRAGDEQGGLWECLRCAQPVRRAERVQGGVAYLTSEGEGSGEDWGSDYFDEMGSSLSGVSGLSIGSRSWISGSEGDVSE